jgi:alanine racemase
VELQKAVAEINLKNLSSNLRLVRKKTGNKDVLAVVKADAYGHGAVQVSRHLIKNKVSMLGVAFAAEGIELREAGIKTPIVVFFDTKNIDAFLKYNLTPAVFDLKTAKRLSIAAAKKRKRISIHIKIDTGMGRVGFDVESALTEIPEIAGLKNIKPEGLMSHFSDADLKNKRFANRQIRKFNDVIERLKAKGITFRYIHMANSAAVLTLPESHFNMVRPGIMLYGYGCCENENLKPVMSLKSKVLFVKNVPGATPISYGRTFVTKKRSTIATIPVGYADGYSRKLSNKGKVIINGKFAPVAGRVCMDAFMVDVTNIPDVTQNSEAVLIGSRGKKKITADDIANQTGTIPYEVLTSIGKRVERVYKS